MKVLVALAQKRGLLVTREELVERCWDGRVVGDDVINRAILLLRSVSKESGGFAIETVPKAGYRLVEEGKSAGPLSKPWLLVLALGAVLLLASLWIVASRAGDPNEAEHPSVALRSFVSDADPAFERIGRAIDAALVQSLGGSGMAPRRPTGAEDPATDLVLSGSLHHRGGQAVASLRLEDSQTGAVLIAKQIAVPVEQASTLPDRLAAYAAATLTWTGAQIALDRKHPLEPQLASRLLSQGAIAIEMGDWMRAYELSLAAASQAPDSAFAQLGLAMSSGFVLGDLPRDEQAPVRRRALVAAAKARALAPGFGDVYLPGCLLGPLDDFAACEDQLRLGMAKDPDAPFVSAYLRRWMAMVGRTEEADGYAKISLAGAPYMPAKMANQMIHLELAGEGDAAGELYRDGRRWWPDARAFFAGRLSAMAQRQAWDDARRFAIAERDADPALSGFAAALSAAVLRSDAEGVLAQCPADLGSSPRTSLCLAALSDVGALDRAFAVADRAYPSVRGNTRYWRGPRVFHQLFDDPTLLTSPALGPFRADPRFIDLASRLGLLRYWQQRHLPDICTKASPEPICARIRRA